MKDLRTVLDTEVKMREHSTRQKSTHCRVPRRQSVHLQLPACRPICGRYAVRSRLGLLLDDEVLLNPLQAKKVKSVSVATSTRHSCLPVARNLGFVEHSDSIKDHPAECSCPHHGQSGHIYGRELMLTGHGEREAGVGCTQASDVCQIDGETDSEESSEAFDTKHDPTFVAIA